MKTEKVLEMFDVCTKPRVTQHTSIQYSSFCHMRVNVGASIFFTASGRNVNYNKKQLTGGEKKIV
jgi:hypothetical protein